MAANLKGNLGLKSSPLAPTACKLSAQYLVLDHMTSHYNKIAKAKSSIDSKPPKCLNSSQKMRDRKRRERILSGSSPRPRPTSGMSHIHTDEYDHILDDEPEDEEERQVYAIMRSTLQGNKPHGSNNATYGSSYMESQYPDTHMSQQFYHTSAHQNYTSSNANTYARPISARSARSGHSVISATSRGNMGRTVQTHDPTRITYSGDVLDKRAHVFTEGDRPFTPRTLKTNHESRLKSSKCYNPPARSASAKGHRSDELDKNENKAPKPAPRGQKHQEDVPPSRDHNKYDLQDTMETSQLSESMLMDITLRSRDGRHGQEGGHQVPPLAISMDKDHMNWLQEQASKAEVRARSSGRLRASLHKDDDHQPVNRQATLGEAVKMETKKNPHSSYSSRSLASHLSSSTWISQRLMEEDEEQKYLAFAKEVTDDVVARGICSDSVLQRVFENHIERKKHELDEERLRSVIRDLRRKLGLTDTSYELKPVASLSDSNYNNNIEKVSVVVNGSQNGSAQQHSGSSKSTSGKDSSSLKYPQMNGDTSTTLEPLHVMTSQSELSTTLESTSTMKFGQTGDMFSTINSEATREAEEAEMMNGDSELTVTQALKQYQFNLTVKEASGDISTSARESEVANSNSEHSPNVERPATGERRRDEEVRSDTSSVKAHDPSSSENTHRMKRRDRFRRARETENSSSANNSQPSSEHGFNRHTSDEQYSSDKSATDFTHAPKYTGAQKERQESADTMDDGDVSVKSSASSQRPAVKPRTKLRKGSSQSSQGADESHLSPQVRKGSHHSVQGMDESRQGTPSRKGSHASVRDGEESHELGSARRGSRHSVQDRKGSHHSIQGMDENHQGTPSRKGSHTSVHNGEENHEPDSARRGSRQSIQDRKGSHHSMQDVEEIPEPGESFFGRKARSASVTDKDGGQQLVHSRRGSHQSAQNVSHHQNSSASATAATTGITDEEKGEEGLHGARGGKRDHSDATAQVDSGAGSAEAAAGHNDLKDDAPGANRQVENNHHILHQQAPGSERATEKSDEDYEDDYEDDYNADEDEGQGDTTHRTSDDDF